MSDAPHDLRGAAAIVTGAAQGLGAAIATAYAQAGMRLALMDNQADKLSVLVNTLNHAGGDCTAIPVDLSDADATMTATEIALQKYSTPRILVHNAAILRVTPFTELAFGEWSRVVNIALQAGYILAHAVWPHMVAAGGGSIVLVSSRSGIEGFDGESAYCASKHALEGLMKSLALEGKAVNIAVNTITPGMAMHTPMSERNYTDDLKQKWVDPIRLTPAFLTLARQDASGITGQRCNAWELSEGVTP